MKDCRPIVGGIYRNEQFGILIVAGILDNVTIYAHVPTIINVHLTSNQKVNNFLTKNKIKFNHFETDTFDLFEISSFLGMVDDVVLLGIKKELREKGVYV